MLSALRRPLTVAVALTFAAELLAAGAAGAATTQQVRSQRGDGATLTVSPKGQRKLAKQGVTLAVRTPGVRRNSSYTLPSRSGRWDFTSATGTINLGGGLQLRLGKRSVVISAATFSRPSKGSSAVTVAMKGAKVKLLVLSGRPRVTKSGQRETVSGLTASLARPSAGLINKLLRRRALSAGQVLGSFTISVTGPASSSASRKPAAAADAVGISFAQQFASLPGGQALSILPISPASPGLPGPIGTTTVPGADGSQVTLPLAGSSAAAGFDRGTLTGTVPLSGGLTLGNGDLSASLTNPVLTLGTGTAGSALSFQVNGGPQVKLFSIDTSQLRQSATPNGSLDLQGLLATLSTEGASSLNTALGTNAFTTGQPVGGLTVIMPALPGQGS